MTPTTSHDRPTPRVLVIGASGNTGRRISERLAASGVLVRAATRSRQAPEGAAEQVRFDWSDASTHGPALQGVDRMYLIAPAAVEDPDSIMLPFIDEALARGVRRVVLLSSSAIPEGAPGLGTVHQALRERAPEWTVLQPSWFMQNLLGTHHLHGKSLEEHGTVTTATGDGRVGFVDVLDIAEVAARALADAQPHDTAHHLTGPEALSYDDIASILTRATGQPKRHVRVSRDDSARLMVEGGIPERYAALLARMEDAIAHGAEARLTPTVERVTGRPPRSFQALVRASLQR
ncbi:NmrA family NAD(P)-binding protein [Chondromyces apiculatus]|uniref:Oxidoreductase n=1 Tax=Chondromyces apiculatus DSM 436 TaxID=1192034 RepID=A0A017TEA2_9BACT|nr:NAD(P)H-binding protein [Chondromyces apiculatus]EYF07150.1 Oxidoreductase [Chondromyces apiculatus DSM 436]